MSVSEPGRGQGPGNRWKALLAGLSLALCALLWLNGLVGSLERPSVGDALTRRQLQLELLAAPALPAPLQPLLNGEQAATQLEQQLQAQLQADPGPGQPEALLQLALLQSQRGDAAAARANLRRLEPQVPPEQRPLLTALEQRQRDGGAAGSRNDEAVADLIAPWRASASPLNRQLLCQALQPPGSACGEPALQRQAAWRLLGVSALPALLLLVGLGLLLRELWLGWRGRITVAPLLGPTLDLLDVTLLIAGGFVVLGELSVPLLLAPLSQWLLAPLAATPVRQQGLQVLIAYAGLMVPPLLILRQQLAGLQQEPPPGGWLQWRWQPLAGALRRAVSQVLMVLPVVSLGGWLVEQVVGDPGGSNPLLELVLTAGDPIALGCFGFTAVVLAPLFEETLFRGVLLPVLARRWGAWAGVGMSALTFALAHLSLGELLPLLLLGLGLGWLRLRSGRLAPCVLMHALWNGLTFSNLLLLS